MTLRNKIFLQTKLNQSPLRTTDKKCTHNGWNKNLDPSFPIVLNLLYHPRAIRRLYL